MRSKVEIENVAEDFTCWQRYGAKLVGNSSSAEEPETTSIGYGGSAQQDAASHGSDAGWEWFKDPRLDCLGYRGIFRSGVLRKFLNGGFKVVIQIFRSHEVFGSVVCPIELCKFLWFFSVAAPLVEAGKEVGEEQYHLWRLEKGVAEGSTEIPKGTSSRL